MIAQINPSMPRTLGDSFVHVDQIDLGVHVDQPPSRARLPPVGDVERRIGEYVAELIPNRSTIQMGIGSIPTAVAMALHTKRDLGVHTELLTDPVIDLVEAGAVTGAAKEINRGKIVTAFLMGSQRLYDFVDDNPMIEMRPVDYTNDTSVIRRFRRMVAINSAISVDLTGQVSADSIGTRFYSGVGARWTSCVVPRWHGRVAPSSPCPHGLPVARCLGSSRCWRPAPGWLPAAPMSGRW